MSNPDELSDEPERLTVPGVGLPEASSEELEDAQVLALKDERPQAPLVLDASFVLAVLDGDPAAMRLVDLLRGSVLPSPTAGEVYLKVAERSGLPPVQVESVLLAYGVRLVDLPLAATHYFPSLRNTGAAYLAALSAAGYKGGEMSMGDLCVLGYAQHTGLPVLTSQRDWTHLHEVGLTVPVHIF